MCRRGFSETDSVEDFCFGLLGLLAHRGGKLAKGEAASRSVVHSWGRSKCVFPCGQALGLGTWTQG